MEDHALVERSQAGDIAAFEALVRRHQGRAYGIAFQILRNREDAEEVAQEAFVRVYQSLSGFRREAQFSTWLYRIVVNLSTDRVRKRSRTGTEVEVPLDLAGGEDPAKGADQRRLREAIQAAVETLSEEHRLVILLREIEGLSYEEIAAACGCPVGTVMSRLFQARRKLQEKLRPLWEANR